MQDILWMAMSRRVVVRGWSMHPSFQPGDRVLLYERAYHKTPPAKGDVVLAWHPKRPGLLLVKRVLAGPMDVLEKRGNELTVNSRHPDWVKRGQHLNASFLSEDRWMLGEDEYFLVGEHPYRSTDSRHLGTFRREHIKAKAWLVYWPPSRWKRL